MSIFGKTLSDIGCKCLEINGKEPDCENENYKFCPWCVDQFEEMESVDQCYMEHEDSDYENKCYDCKDSSMNAHKFVAEHGIDEVKRVLGGAHWGNIAYSNGHYYSQSFSKNDVNLEELKQVVESLDLIKFYDGIVKSKIILNMGVSFSDRPPHPRELQLKKSIADYELVESYKRVKND